MATDDRAGAAPVSLSKVTLTKASPAISLEKASTGAIQVNLNWQQGAPAERPKGLARFLKGGGGSSGAVDLDLGCLYELADGTKGVVQALGRSFEAYAQGRRDPVIRLDGDDRSGATTGGENLTIDLAQADLVRRVLVFAYIYEGAPDWAHADGVVTLTQPSGQQIVVHLDEPDPAARFCAIALITGHAGQLGVERQVRYVDGNQADVDRAYDWGLDWSPARK